jgi:hypothetical protein
MLYFARDKNGVYIGTKEEMMWTDEELEERYGRYKEALPVAGLRGNSALNAGGWGASDGFGIS